MLILIQLIIDTRSFRGSVKQRENHYQYQFSLIVFTFINKKVRIIFLKIDRIKIRYRSFPATTTLKIPFSRPNIKLETHKSKL